MTNKIKNRILLAICLVAVAIAMIAPRIPQDQAYHRFADKVSLFAIPSAFNVLTNLLFIAIGLYGLDLLLRRKTLQVENRIHSAYLLFFAALVLIGFGSGYYHWAPDNHTLVPDRLPIGIAFMSFFTVLIGERISLPLARRLFPWLLVAGVGSTVYWHFTELSGNGDLRPYALVVFLPALLTPLFLLMYESRYDRSSDIWWILFWYAVSRLFEWLDHEVYETLLVVSGHSLKHISAAIGGYVFLRHLQLRRSLTP